MSSIALRASSLANIKENIETRRIKKHLNSVLSYLEKREYHPDLSLEQNKKRKETLKNLQKYIMLGEFPKNHVSLRRLPVFKDEAGNYCAVGYLLHKNGRDDLVDEIQATNNYVYVEDITQMRYLSAINGLGLTKEEAARVQPGYGWDPYPADTNNETLEFVRLIAVSLYILFQLFSLLLIRQLNMTTKQKTYSFLVLITGSTLILMILWALTVLE